MLRDTHLKEKSGVTPKKRERNETRQTNIKLHKALNTPGGAGAGGVDAGSGFEFSLRIRSELTRMCKENGIMTS